jgi:hypothetical protein
MQALGVLLLLTTAAAADPASGAATPDPQDRPNSRPAIRLGPSRVVEVEPWQPPARKTTQTPGVNGAMASGIVIDPGPHGDARPWPYGMLIHPPDTGDRNVLVLGSDDLPGPLPDTLSGRLTRKLDAGVGTMLELLMTPKFIKQL